MKNILNYKKNYFRFILCLVFLLGFFLRFFGLKPGYPANHPDEPVIYGTAIEMALNRVLDPFRFSTYKFQYPSFIPYLNTFLYTGFFIPLSILKNLILHPKMIFLNLGKLDKFVVDFIVGPGGINALFWSRYITAFLGFLSLPLIYLIGKKLFNRYVGLVAALFLGVNFRHIISSHLGLIDAPNSTFALLALFLCLRLLEKPTRKNYILAAVGVALSLACKLHFFSFPPLFFSHFLISLRKKNLKEMTRSFFGFNFWFSMLVILIIFLVLNPFLLFNLDRAIKTHQLNNSRYGLGSIGLILPPVWYLYEVGFSKAFSFLFLFGIVNVLFKRKYWLKSLYLLFYIFPPLSILLYFSHGGVYTRNFTSIIPFMILFSALSFVTILKFCFSKQKFFAQRWFLTTLLVGAVVAGFTQLKNSLIMDYSLSQEWNSVCLENWIEKRAENETLKIAVTSWIPRRDKKQIIYSNHNATYIHRTPFSLPELQEAGVDYVLINHEFPYSYFNWWVGQGTKFWEMPVEVLDNTFPSIALKELSRYTEKKCFKPWQSIDYNYSVFKIPAKTKDVSLEIIRSYSFDEDRQDSKNGWQGKEQGGVDIQGYEPIKDSTCFKKGCVKIKSKSPPLFPERFSSELIPVIPGKKYVVRGHIKAESYITDKQRDGFLRIDFYEDKDLTYKRGVRSSVSTRYQGEPNWQEKEASLIAPYKAQFMRVSFQEEDFYNTNFYLDEVRVYQSEDFAADEEIEMVNREEVDNLILYPIAIL